MPVVSRFFGISIKMFFNDHLPPHFHAVYAEYNGIISIETLEQIEGDLPIRALKLVQEWAGNYQNDLKIMWETKDFKKLPGLV